MNMPGIDSTNEPRLQAEFDELVSLLVAIREAERTAHQGDGMAFLVSRVLSYKIEIWPKEEGHNHPHFHVIAPDYEGSYRIDNQLCLVGGVPRKHEKEIQKWAARNKRLLEDEWRRAHPVSITRVNDFGCSCSLVW